VIHDSSRPHTPGICFKGRNGNKSIAMHIGPITHQVTVAVSRSTAQPHAMFNLNFEATGPSSEYILFEFYPIGSLRAVVSSLNSCSFCLSSAVTVLVSRVSHRVALLVLVGLLSSHHATSSRTNHSITQPTINKHTIHQSTCPPIHLVSTSCSRTSCIYLFMCA